MGIPGLVQWLVEHHCAAPLNGGLPALITPERNRFIVDANAWSQMVTTLLHDKTDRMRGGQWALVYAVCEAFVAELCAAGAHLVFIFDGVRPASKSSVLKHRRWFYSTKAWRKAQACADYNHQNYWDRHRFVNAIAAEVGLGLQYHEESTAAALRALGARYAVEVCEAPAGTDADVSVVALCRQQRRSVAAVLGADNDLMLMPHRCRVVTYRLGLDEARRVRVDLNHVVDTCAVARLLGGEGRMPLFATLVGCDYSDCFFQYRQARAGSIRGKNPHRFEVVAALVKKLCTGRLQGGELEDELAKAWAAEDARAPGSPETEDLDSDGSEAELALDGACDPDGAGDFAGARDAAAAAPVRGDAGPDHGPGSGPGPIDAAADSDAAAADTGDGVADVQVTVQEVLQTLAARIKTTSQRRTFLEDAAEAVRFFCANTGGVQVLPYSGCQPTPHRHETVLPMSISDYVMRQRKEIRTLQLCVEYFKHAKARGRPDWRLGTGDQDRPVEVAYYEHTPRIEDVITRKTSPAFNCVLVHLPSDVADVLRGLPPAAAPAAVLQHVVAPTSTFAADPQLSNDDRVVLMALDWMLHNGALAPQELWLALAHYALCRAGAALSPEAFGRCAAAAPDGVDARTRPQLRNTSACAVVDNVPAAIAPAAVRAALRDCGHRAVHAFTDASPRMRAAAAPPPQPSHRHRHRHRHRGRRRLSSVEEAPAEAEAVGQYRLWLQFNFESHARAAVSTLRSCDELRGCRASVVFRRDVAPEDGRGIDQPAFLSNAENALCPAAVALGHSLQAVLRAVHRLNDLLGAYPDVGFAPWHWYDGRTLQALHADCAGVLSREAPADAVAHAEALFAAMQRGSRHEGLRGLAMTYAHDCGEQFHVEEVPDAR